MKKLSLLIILIFVYLPQPVGFAQIASQEAKSNRVVARTNDRNFHSQSLIVSFSPNGKARILPSSRGVFFVEGIRFYEILSYPEAQDEIEISEKQKESLKKTELKFNEAWRAAMVDVFKQPMGIKDVHAQEIKSIFKEAKALLVAGQVKRIEEILFRADVKKFGILNTSRSRNSDLFGSVDRIKLANKGELVGKKYFNKASAAANEFVSKVESVLTEDQRKALYNYIGDNFAIGNQHPDLLLNQLERFENHTKIRSEVEEKYVGLLATSKFRLDALSQLLPANQKRPSYHPISLVIADFCSDKFGQSSLEMTREQISAVEELSKKIILEAADVRSKTVKMMHDGAHPTELEKFVKDVEVPKLRQIYAKLMPQLENILVPKQFKFLEELSKRNQVVLDGLPVSLVYGSLRAKLKLRDNQLTKLKKLCKAEYRSLRKELLDLEEKTIIEMLDCFTEKQKNWIKGQIGEKPQNIQPAISVLHQGLNSYR